MNYEKEMAKYRARVIGKRGRRGRRKTDVLPKSFFVPEMIWQFLFVLLSGIILLAACTRTVN